MGLFDLLEKVVEVGVETIVSLPTIPVKIVKGVVNGIEKGIDKVDDIL